MAYFLEKEEMKKFSVICCVLFLFLSISFATPIVVGSGQDSAGVRIEWSDGYVAEFLVSFDGDMTGMGLLDIIESQTTLEVITQDFGFGLFVDGISFDSHSNISFGGGENWWHNYTKDAGQIDWTASWVGASDRVVNSGDWDGWSYGHEIPEPATMAMLGLGSVLLRRKC
jgi:hypothetical protein